MNIVHVLLFFCNIILNSYKVSYCMGLPKEELAGIETACQCRDVKDSV